jgi:cytochrome c553
LRNVRNSGLVELGLLPVVARCQFIFTFLALTTLPFGAAQSQPADRAPDTMAARVLACASCHGAEGEGTSDVYFPRLAGKPAGYLYNQLIAFRDGRRKYPPMNYLLEFLPDAYLKQIAEHFAALRPPFPAPATPTESKEVLARGELIAKNGDPQRGIPPCAACHNPNFGAWSPRYPACSACAPATSARSSGGGATAPEPPRRRTACRSLPAS